MHLEQWKNCKKLKGDLNWVNAVLTDSDEPFNFDHFAFRFETKNPNDLINFTFSSINEKEELIEFTGTKKKS